MHPPFRRAPARRDEGFSRLRDVPRRSCARACTLRRVRRRASAVAEERRVVVDAEVVAAAAVRLEGRVTAPLPYPVVDLAEAGEAGALHVPVPRRCLRVALLDGLGEDVLVEAGLVRVVVRPDAQEERVRESVEDRRVEPDALRVPVRREDRIEARLELEDVDDRTELVLRVRRVLGPAVAGLRHPIEVDGTDPSARRGDRRGSRGSRCTWRAGDRGTSWRGRDRSEGAGRTS